MSNCKGLSLTMGCVTPAVQSPIVLNPVPLTSASVVLGVRLVNEHPQLVRSIRPKRFVQLLQRTCRVQVPAWRTPRGRDLHHGNLSLVQNVGVQRMGVPVDVGHREVRCRSKLSIHAGPKGQREKRKP